MTTKPLAPRALLFVDHLVADPLQRRTIAAVAAGYPARSAHVRANELMSDKRVRAMIVERSKDRLMRMQLTQDDVLRDLFNVVKSDARDLSEYRIGCCRYCHGAGFMYHMTPQEYRDRLSNYMTRMGVKDPAGLGFDLLGGVGFDAKKKPHPSCPECHGEGIGREVFKDSRSLSKSAATLYAGVKRTKNGIEMMSRSKDKAIELAARHTGVIKSASDKTGEDDGIVQVHGGLPSGT